MSKSSRKLAEDRTDYAADRTDWAEDRTAMANERTFAGWMRTALAAIGIGIGFNALFAKLDPTWVPKVIATLFIVLGIVLIHLAQRRACAAFARLTAHAVDKPDTFHVRAMSCAVVLGATVLIVAIWTMVDPSQSH